MRTHNTQIRIEFEICRWIRIHQIYKCTHLRLRMTVLTTPSVSPISNAYMHRSKMVCRNAMATNELPSRFVAVAYKTDEFKLIKVLNFSVRLLISPFFSLSQLFVGYLSADAAAVMCNDNRMILFFFSRLSHCMHLCARVCAACECVFAWIWRSYFCSLSNRTRRLFLLFFSRLHFIFILL